MTWSSRWLMCGVLAIGGSALPGCQSGPVEEADASEETRPLKASVGREEIVPNAEITPEMRRFDAGIGDTATETGGGGNDPRDIGVP